MSLRCWASGPQIACCPWEPGSVNAAFLRCFRSIVKPLDDRLGLVVPDSMPLCQTSTHVLSTPASRPLGQCTTRSAVDPAIAGDPPLGAGQRVRDTCAVPKAMSDLHLPAHPVRVVSRPLSRGFPSRGQQRCSAGRGSGFLAVRSTPSRCHHACLLCRKRSVEKGEKQSTRWRFVDGQR